MEDHDVLCAFCLLCPQQPRVCWLSLKEGGCLSPAVQTHAPSVMLLLIKYRMEKIKAVHFPSPTPPFFFSIHSTGLFLILNLHLSLLQCLLVISPVCLVEFQLVLDCHFNLATSESCFPMACQLNWCVTDECTAHRWCLSV